MSAAPRLQLVGAAPVLVPAGALSSRPVRLTRGCVYHLRVTPAVVVDEGTTTVYDVPVFVVPGDLAAEGRQPQGHVVTSRSPLTFTADVETITLMQAPYAVAPAWSSVDVYASISEVE